MSAYLAVVAAVLLVGLASVLAAHPALPPPPPRALLSHQAPTPAGAALGAALGVFQEAGLAGPGAVQRAFQPEAGGRLVAAAKVSGVHGLAALTKMQQEQLKWQVGVALGHWRWVQEGSRSSFSRRPQRSQGRQRSRRARSLCRHRRGCRRGRRRRRQAASRRARHSEGLSHEPKQRAG